MAKRKLPPRYKSGPKKGQFKPKSARRRSSSSKSRKRKRTTTRRRRNPGRTTRSRTRTRRRRARSNPRRMPVLQQFTDGVVEAGQILVGKAAARSIPDIVNLPKEGNVGLAIQAGTALVIGYVADMFLSRDASRAMTAGALTAPLETLIVSSGVPWLAPALSPTSAANNLSAYTRRRSVGVGRYARAKRIPSGSSERGLGRYATERGMTAAYSG